MPKFGYWSVKDIEGHAFIERLAAKEGCGVIRVFPEHLIGYFV